MFIEFLAFGGGGDILGLGGGGVPILFMGAGIFLILTKKMPIFQFRKLQKAVAVSGVFAGVLQENSGKIQGKIAGFFPETRNNALNCRISGTGKGKPAGNLGPTLQDLVPTFRAGCFLKSTVPAFLSFSD